MKKKGLILIVCLILFMATQCNALEVKRTEYSIADLEKVVLKGCKGKMNHGGTSGWEHGIVLNIVKEIVIFLDTPSHKKDK